MKFTARVSALAALGVAAVLAVAGCSAGGSSPAGNDGSGHGGTLNLGIIGEPTSWDPSQAHVGHALQPFQVTYDSLLRREPDGKLVPMLATSWKYNDDNTALTLDLRDDVTFSDGAAFNAEAVKANLENFKSGNGRQASQLAALAGVDVVDADTVTLKLSQPDPALEFYLSQAAGLMGSPASIGTESIISTPVGSGPYVMDAASSVAGSQLVFTAREGYWNPDLQKYDKIVLKSYQETTARLNAILSGQVDATILDAPTAAQAKSAGLAQIEDYRVDWQGLVLMDRDGSLVPALADKRVRQAINYALDRDTLLESILLGYGKATDQVFGPDSGAYVDDLDGAYGYDPAKAKKLLADAGYPDGFDLPLPAIPGFETPLAALTQQLADVGIRVQSQPVATSTFLADLAAGKFPAVYFNYFQGEPWVAINQLISTNALYNPFKTMTPELQQLVDAVQTGGADSSERAKKVNEYVTNEAWFAPVYRIDQVYVYKSDVVSVEKQIQSAVPAIYNYTPAG